MTARFTVDITGTTGMRTGEWAEGEEFSILPERRRPEREVAGRVRLCSPGHPGVRRGGAGAGAAAAEAAAGLQSSRPVTVAEVEERIRTGGSVPHPVLVLHGRDGAPVCTAYPEEPGAQPYRFLLVDDRDRPLCRIVRGPSRLGRRGSWRIDFPDGRPSVVGYRGTPAGWLCYILLLPLWVLFFLGSLLISLLSLGTVAEMLVWSCPKSVTWRRRGAFPPAGKALAFSYLRTDYRWDHRRLEKRIAYTMAALHYFTRMHKD